MHLLQFLDMLVEDLKSALALKQFEKARQLVSSTYIHTTIMCILPVRLSFNIYFSLYSIEITSFTFYDSHDLMHSPFPLSPFSPFSSLFLPLTKVRFLADLVNAKVVGSSSIMSLFDTFITVTYEPDIPQVVQTFIEWLHLSYDSHMTPMWLSCDIMWLSYDSLDLMWLSCDIMWLACDSWHHMTHDLMWLSCDSYVTSCDISGSLWLLLFLRSDQIGMCTWSSPLSHGLVLHTHTHTMFHVYVIDVCMSVCV